MADIKAETKAIEKEVIKSDSTDGMIFPRQFPSIVFVRRVPIPAKLPGQDISEAILKIGSSFKGNSVLRGLTFEEEHKYLPSIIGADVSSPNWESQTRDYWINISKPVPPGDGLELEVGLQYNSKEDYIYDRDVAKRDSNGTLVNHKGTPINIADYILWRYCLYYSRVANTFELRGMSPKIEFYLFSKSREISDKKETLNSKRKAISLMYKRISERDWVDYVLRVLIARDKSHTKTVSSIAKMSEDEKDILLDEYVATNPEGFLLLAEDKNLEMRSFIEQCIAMGKLTRIANTDTVTMEGTPLGNSVIDVISFLNNPKNNETLQILKAQIKHLPQ